MRASSAFRPRVSAAFCVEFDDCVADWSSATTASRDLSAFRFFVSAPFSRDSRDFKSAVKVATVRRGDFGLRAADAFLEARFLVLTAEDAGFDASDFASRVSEFAALLGINAVFPRVSI